MRHTPFFKPDWSPDTFISFMYTGCFGVYKTSVLQETGTLREGPAAAAVYDFTLRFMERSSNDRIGHIQKILYHRIEYDNSAEMIGIQAELQKVKEEMLEA